MKCNRKISSAAAYLAGLFFSPVFFAAVFFLSTAPCLAAGKAENTSVTPIVDPFSDDTSYSAILYDNTNGLPSSEANAIAQTSDGFIWIGSYSGLVRYDGNSFERMNEGTGITSVTCLYADSADRLWIGTNESGVFLMQDNEIQDFDGGERLAETSVRSITEDKDGRIYIGTTDGITVAEPDLTSHLMADPASQVFVNSLCFDAEGILYAITNDGDVLFIKEEQVQRTVYHDEIEGGGITALFPDPAHPGFMYFETIEASVVYGTPESGFKSFRHIDTSPLSQVSRFVYLGGRIWLCARNGIGVIEKDGTFRHLADVPMNNNVGHVIADHAGDLWFTSSRQGVMKIVPNRFTDITEKYGLPDQVINSTCLFDGLLYVASDNGLSALDENGPVENISLKQCVTAGGEDLGYTDLIEMLDGIRIRSLIRDDSGNLWIATWRKYGMLRFDGETVTAFSTDDGLFSDHVRVAYPMGDGSVLVANTGGVSVIYGNEVAASYGEADGIVNSEILTVCSAPNGDILCGSDGGGIYIFGEDGMQLIDREDGLTSGAVMRIKYDRARDIFWIITGNSLAYMTSAYEVTTISNFPYFNNLDLYENSRGEMWVLSSDGIYVAPTERILANEDIDPQHYTVSGGLPCITTANSYSELTEDGDLFLSGTTGIAKVNIEETSESIRDLKASIPFIDADGKRLYPETPGTFRVGSSVKKITIHGFVFNYSLVNPEITYRLDGFEEAPVTMSTSDFIPVDYTNLRGGTYRFIMEISDPITRESVTVAAQIVKEKAFYEEAWFYALAALLLISLIVISVRHYVRRKMRILEEKHREEAEMQRISTELSTAALIQESALPSVFPAFPEHSEFDIYAAMDPAKEVGGDFYDFFKIGDDYLCLVMADVSGKGIPAALFMMIANTTIRNIAMLGCTPGEILTRTNDALCRNNVVNMFVTVWVGILEISSGHLMASNAGHEYPAIRRNGGNFELLKDKHGFVIGGMEGIYYREYELDLEPGDRLFLYTDGVPEATDAENNLFGTDRMIDALNTQPDGSPEEILKNVRTAVDGFVQDAEQFDDLTMLCLEYKG